MEAAGIRTRAFWLPKAGNAPEEYEDAAWPDRPLVLGGSAFRCAVADGATETSFAGLWARILVRAYCRGRIRPLRMGKSLVPLRVEWKACAGSSPLPWYAEEKLRLGAFSSLIGLTLARRGTTGSGWTALAVGDSCLFQLRGGRLVCAFPLDRSTQFTSCPYLISSVIPNLVSGAGSDDVRLAAYVVTTEGECQPGDTFYLMTDALACWFLRALEQDRDPCAALTAACVDTSGREFALWIDALRHEVAIRNDDVTLLQVDLE